MTARISAPVPNDSLEGPRYPTISVQLTGTDGNAFAVLGRVRNALRSSGVSDAEIEAFTKAATAGNYDNLLATAMRWVDVR